jgi:hypothetical protein
MQMAQMLLLTRIRYSYNQGYTKFAYSFVCKNLPVTPYMFF